MTFQWSRPDNSAYPKIWLEFEAKESKSSAQQIKYRIEDLREDRIDELLEIYCSNHMSDEPLMKAINAANDQDYIDDLIEFQREILKQKLTLICVRNDTNAIVGLNFLTVTTKGGWVSAKQWKSIGFRDEMRMLDYISSKFCPYEKYNVREYLASTGLTVARQYRGLGIGVKFLEARKLVATAFNIRIIHGHFSSVYSNRCAERSGFQEDIRFTWDEFSANIPNFVFKNVESDGYFVRTFEVVAS